MSRTVRTLATGVAAGGVLVAGGAAVALGRAQATYEIKGLGLGPGILPLILGDLPVLGNLFRHTHKTKDYSEVVIFITASIVND